MARLIEHMDAFDIETANREHVRRQMHLEVHRYLEDQPANVISHLDQGWQLPRPIGRIRKVDFLSGMKLFSAT